MWTSQNSTPLRHQLVGTTILGVFTSDQPAAAGQKLFPESTTDARSFVSLFGAVLNGSFLNGYNSVLEVVTADERSFRFRFFSGDPGLNPAGGITSAIALPTPLAVVPDGKTVTFKTVVKHGLVNGIGLKIGDPNPDFTIGNFTKLVAVTGVPSETSLVWDYETAPGGNGPPGSTFGAIWQVGQLMAQGNVIELADTSHPDTYGYSVGIADFGGNYRPQYQFRRALIQENIVRLLPGISAPAALGTQTSSAENLLVQKNVVDVVNSAPIQGGNNKVSTYFENRSPTGTLLRGFDSHTTVPADQHYYDEIATMVEDALLFAL